jgi:polysaccharide biosynthesis transport protein
MQIPAGKLREPIPIESSGAVLPYTGNLDRPRNSVTYSTQETQVKYFSLLRRHRLAVILIMSLCLLAGILFARFAPRTYKVQTVVEITGVNQDFLKAGSTSPDSYLETQIMLLQNESVIDRVVDTMAPKVSETLAPDAQNQRDMIRSILATAKAKQEGQSNLVRITLTGPDPQLIADTANELTHQYIQKGQDARLSAASETGTFLKQQLEDAKSKLQKSEDALQDYARASGIVLTSDTHESVSTERLREIQQGLSQAQLDRADRQSKMEMARKSSIDAVPQVLDDPTIREDRSKLTELRRQLAEMSTTMTPANYRVQKIQAQIQDLESEMQRHRSVIVNRLSVEDKSAARREELLKQDYERQLAVVTDQEGKQVRFNMLKHDVDVNLQVYQSMLQRVKEAGVIVALRAADARIASPAKAPFLPYSPRLSICLLLATLLGMVSSLLYILVAERKDNSVRNPGQSEQYVDRPELAVIPRARLANKASRIPVKLEIGSSSTDAKSVHPMLEHWKEADRTFLAEAYRSAGTSILFSTNGAVSPQVLLVTSPHPQCGKTTTTANLAVSLAEGGRHVLLIDGDLRRPALAQFFGVKNIEGLTDALDEDGRMDMKDLVLPTAFPGVHILPSGAIKGSVAKMLHSRHLSSVINTARNNFDFILIDAPPLLGLADARILSKFSDGVILICRAGRTSIDDLDEARRLLVEDGTHILGTILNGYDLKREGSAHSSSYSQYIGTR